MKVFEKIKGMIGNIFSRPPKQPADIELRRLAEKEEAELRARTNIIMTEAKVRGYVPRK